MRFSEYLNRVRVDNAKELLLHSKLTIREISEQCGFNSVQNFSRVFKQYAAHTPGEYRKRKE